MRVKLFIYDNGDSSVGIFPQDYSADFPYEVESIERGEVKDKDEKRDLEWFRDHIIDLYKEFAQGRVWGWYSFEQDETERRIEEDSKIKREDPCEKCDGVLQCKDCHVFSELHE